MENLRAKYEEMHASGIAKLQSDDLSESLWKGITPQEGQNQILAAMFCENNHLHLILLRIKMLAERYGVGLILADRDFPFHVTLQQGTPQAIAEPLPNLVKRFEVFEGESFSFGHLILGPNILLASTNVPPLVTVCRETVSSIMESYYVTPKPISILHATVARITEVPNATVLAEFVRMLKVLSDTVRVRPCELMINRLTFGTLEELLQPVTVSA